jgi:hypothetical protein
LIDTNEGDKIDFWILTNDSFDESRFERKYTEDLFGANVKVSTPEDTIQANSDGRNFQVEVRNNSQMHCAYLKFNMQYLILIIWMYGRLN